MCTRVYLIKSASRSSELDFDNETHPDVASRRIKTRYTVCSVKIGGADSSNPELGLWKAARVSNGRKLPRGGWRGRRGDARGRGKKRRRKSKDAHRDLGPRCGAKENDENMATFGPYGVYGCPSTVNFHGRGLISPPRSLPPSLPPSGPLPYEREP